MHAMITGLLAASAHQWFSWGIQQDIGLLVVFSYCSSQAFVLGMWAALAPGLSLLRTMIAGVLLLFSWYGIPSVTGLFQPGGLIGDAGWFLIIWAIFSFFVSQLALWPLRLIFSYRIRRKQSLRSEAERRLQLSLMHLVGLSVLCIAPLGTLHIFFLPGQPIGSAALYLGIAAFMANAACLPCLAAAFSSRWTLVWLVVLSGYLLIIGIVECHAINHFLGWPPVGGGIIAGVTLGNLTLTIPVLLTCLLMRIGGYCIAAGPRGAGS